MKYINKLKNYFSRKPFPSFIIAIILAIRWRCRVSLWADINYPWNIRIEKGASIGKCLIVANDGCILIGKNSSVGYGCVIATLGGQIKIGENTSLGPYVVIYGEGGVNIGDNCLLATRSTLIASNHIFSSVDIPIKFQGTSGSGISLGDDCWIGANVVIQDNVKLGKGVIVGSSALVNKSFNDYSIIVGVPAMILRNRKSP